MCGVTRTIRQEEYEELIAVDRIAENLAVPALVGRPPGQDARRDAPLCKVQRHLEEEEERKSRRVVGEGPDHVGCIHKPSAHPQAQRCLHPPRARPHASARRGEPKSDAQPLGARSRLRSCEHAAEGHSTVEDSTVVAKLTLFQMKKGFERRRCEGSRITVPDVMEPMMPSRLVERM